MNKQTSKKMNPAVVGVLEETYETGYQACYKLIRLMMEERLHTAALGDLNDLMAIREIENHKLENEKLQKGELHI